MAENLIEKGNPADLGAPSTQEVRILFDNTTNNTLTKIEQNAGARKVLNIEMNLPRVKASDFGVSVVLPPANCFYLFADQDNADTPSVIDSAGVVTTFFIPGTTIPSLAVTGAISAGTTITAQGMIHAVGLLKGDAGLNIIGNIGVTADINAGGNVNSNATMSTINLSASGNVGGNTGSFAAGLTMDDLAPVFFQNTNKSILYNSATKEWSFTSLDVGSVMTFTAPKLTFGDAGQSISFLGAVPTTVQNVTAAAPVLLADCVTQINELKAGLIALGLFVGV